MKTIYIDDKEIYAEYGVFLQSKNIPLPLPRTYFVDVEGGNGSLDLSTALTGGTVRYHDREGAEFILVTSQGVSYTDARNMLAQQVHGKRVKIELSEEPGFYYQGRLWVSDWGTSHGYIGDFKLTGRLDPFRYGLPFGEDTVTVSGKTTHTVTNSGIAPIMPLLNLSAEMDLRVGNILYRLFPGDNDISLIVEPGEELGLEFDGNGTVTITYQERLI